MKYVIKEIICVEIKRDSVVVGTVRNVHNLLFMDLWESLFAECEKAALSLFHVL